MLLHAFYSLHIRTFPVKANHFALTKTTPPTIQNRNNNNNHTVMKFNINCLLYPSTSRDAMLRLRRPHQPPTSPFRSYWHQQYLLHYFYQPKGVSSVIGKLEIYSFFNLCTPSSNADACTQLQSCRIYNIAGPCFLPGIRQSAD